MSNEYKDYMYDCAQEYLLNTGYVRSIEYCTEWKYGYLIVGYSSDGQKNAYFVWSDDIEGWSFREIFS